MKTCLAIAVVSLLSPSIVAAQTHSLRDTATAYGARLNAKGQPADLNERRYNNRIDSRIDNRLGLRIERYRPDNANNPIAVYQAKDSERLHTTPEFLSPEQRYQQEPARPRPQVEPSPDPD